MQAGHRTKHSGQNVCEMLLIHESHFLSFSNFLSFRPTYVPTLAGDGTQMTDYIAGDTAGGTLHE
ncbi:unnamed protein product, partial [Staurois parvus]